MISNYEINKLWNRLRGMSEVYTLTVVVSESLICYGQGQSPRKQVLR